MKLATLASAAAVLLSAFAGTASASVSSTLSGACCMLCPDGWMAYVRCCVVLLVYVDVDVVVVVVPGSPMF